MRYFRNKRCNMSDGAWIKLQVLKLKENISLFTKRTFTQKLTSKFYDIPKIQYILFAYLSNINSFLLNKISNYLCIALLILK